MYRLIARSQSSKLVKLAESIATKPWDGSTLVLLNAEGTNPAFGPYIVREGNRRLTALRGLQDPDMFEGVLPPAEMTRLRAAAAKAITNGNLPQTVPSLVFGVDEEADLIDRIARRHEGEGGGAGVVDWDTRARTRALGGKDAPAVALLDRLDDDGTYGDTEDIAPTNLTRILGTDEVKIALGIEIVRNKLQPFGENFSPEATRRLMDFMREPDFSVRKIDHIEQRRALARDLTAHRAPAPKDEPEDENEDPNPGGGGGGGGPTPPGPIPPGTPNPPPGPNPNPNPNPNPRPTPPRKTLVPKDFPLGTGNARVSDVLKEGKKLKLDDMPATAGMFMRVILELLVDEYRSRQSPVGDPWKKLHVKVLAVAQDLERRQLLTEQERKAVEHVCTSPHYGITNIVTLHSYVHSLNAPVNVNDVRGHWDALDKFFRVLWTNLP